MTKRYITTAIPYVNGSPHIGHALDYCLADVCARYYRLLHDEVRLQVGTDEHGSKIYQKSKELNLEVGKYIENNVVDFKNFIESLDIEYTDFIRTTSAKHEKRCQEIWQKLSKYIYLAEYEGWYCAGCERFITEKEFNENNGFCPDHQKSYEKLKEENYYFKISDFKEKIRQAIEDNQMMILPEFRKQEVLRMIKDAPDVSISRPKSQLAWGVEVPNDKTQVMYVWIDALSNYITVLGYPDEDIMEWWPALAQFVGKDILRFHAILWPAMLFALGLPLPKTIISHGMVLVNDQKMSKSIGNVIDPSEIINKFGVDAFRYYFLRHFDTFNDSDFTWDKFEKAYNNELANDLGNLVQRLATLANKNDFRLEKIPLATMNEKYKGLMEKFEYSKAFDLIWNDIQELNKRIDKEKPWELAKNNKTDKLNNCLNGLVVDLIDVAYMLQPFIPRTAKKISDIFTNKIVLPPEKPLFIKQ